MDLHNRHSVSYWWMTYETISLEEGYFTFITVQKGLFFFDQTKSNDLQCGFYAGAMCM